MLYSLTSFNIVHNITFDANIMMRAKTYSNTLQTPHFQNKYATNVITSSQPKKIEDTTLEDDSNSDKDTDTHNKCNFFCTFRAFLYKKSSILRIF